MTEQTTRARMEREAAAAKATLPAAEWDRMVKRALGRMVGGRVETVEAYETIRAIMMVESGRVAQ